MPGHDQAVHGRPGADVVGRLKFAQGTLPFLRRRGFAVPRTGRGLVRSPMTSLSRREMRINFPSPRYGEKVRGNSQP